MILTTTTTIFTLSLPLFTVHAVLCQVLGLKEVTVFNTIITTEGRVFIQNPSCILNIDTLSVSTGDVKAHKPSTTLRCVSFYLVYRIIFIYIYISIDVFIYTVQYIIINICFLSFFIQSLFLLTD